MKDFITKLVNSLLAVAFAFGIVVLTYHMTSHEAQRLSAYVLDTVQSTRICQVEFVSPKGSAYPVNNVVTVQSVNVTYDTGLILPYCGVAAVLNTVNVSGTDLENSYITFLDGTTPCPAGTVYSSNSIVLPSNFSSSCTVGITVDGGATYENPAELTIEPASCGTLRTSILRGYGSGFQDFDLSVVTLPTAADTTSANPAFDFGNAITSVDIDYPTTTTGGAQTFQIHLDFVSDIAVDPINGIANRAEIVANAGDGIIEIRVRNEGTGNEVATALNFAYVFNDLLGTDSPLIAYMDPADDEIVQLETRELGTHVNSYNCLINGSPVTNCFTGGTPGNDGGGNALEVLTLPLTLDNEVIQGDSAMVFATNSVGEVEWVTSHPSVLEVVSFSEAAQQDAASIDFVDNTITVLEVTAPGQGAYNLMNCTVDYDSDNNPVPQTETCTLEAAVPVEYNISGINYIVNVSIDDQVVPVTVTGSKLNGFLEGSGAYTWDNGVSMSMSGTVTGTVTGSVSGTYAGTVTGTIMATVQAGGSAAGKGANGVDASYFQGGAFVVGLVTEGPLTDSPGTFVSTLKKQEDDVSHIAMLYGKDPGTSILSAMDTHGCIASFEVDVIEKQVLLQMVGRDPGDVLDVSDTVQINAFVGGANQELEEYQNITASSGIEWFSSNEEVATVDGTGLLTALKPGVTNITARYDTGIVEVGTIESVPLTVTVNKISGLRVTFDKGTEDLLPNETVEKAHESVIIAVHDPQAAGQSFVVEGQTVNITLPAGTYNNDISKVEAIVDQLETDIDALINPTSTLDLINVTTVEGYPGMLILQPNNQSTDHDGDNIEDVDENGIIDIDTTALESDVAILPTYNNAIPLPASETYGLMVVAQYDNGATKLLPPTQFSWVNTPLNYLEQASLDSGLIKMGEHAGTSTVVAKYENADGSMVQSNYLTITVDSGPVIEYVRRIGSGSVTKGSRITMQTKITDVDTVDDITSISTSLVYSTYNTYQQINEDSGAIWFTATPFLNEVEVVDQSDPVVEGEGEDGEGEGETTTTTPTPPATTALQYKIYDIPIEIPVDSNLFDGIYKLILSISDASNHTLNYVYSIRIGEIGKGDVNGDGKTNMVDVILAFQIAAGINPSPTPAELQAANVDGVGGVTLIDVILLFNKVTNKS